MPTLFTERPLREYITMKQNVHRWLDEVKVLSCGRVEGVSDLVTVIRGVWPLRATQVTMPANNGRSRQNRQFRIKVHIWGSTAPAGFHVAG